MARFMPPYKSVWSLSVQRNMTRRYCNIKTWFIAWHKGRIYPLPLVKSNRLFAYLHSQKPVRFPAGQNECFHMAKPSFYPSAVAAGITHYTFVPKVVCQRGTLWKPTFCRSVATLRNSACALRPPKPQKSKRISVHLPGRYAFLFCCSVCPTDRAHL